jgi:DNA-binding MarR family transcriptional regulator
MAEASPTVGAALPELDAVIHAQARLRVMTTLSAVAEGDKLAFPRLQELLDMTPGNLSAHVRKLEDAGYVTVEKSYRGRTPVSWVSITRRGRRAFEAYHEALRAYLG